VSSVGASDGRRTSVRDSGGWGIMVVSLGKVSKLSTSAMFVVGVDGLESCCLESGVRSNIFL
jgi:hypothetical protein